MTPTTYSLHLFAFGNRIYGSGITRRLTILMAVYEHRFCNASDTIAIQIVHQAVIDDCERSSDEGRR